MDYITVYVCDSCMRFSPTPGVCAKCDDPLVKRIYVNHSAILAMKNMVVRWEKYLRNRNMISWAEDTLRDCVREIRQELDGYFNTL